MLPSPVNPRIQNCPLTGAHSNLPDRAEHTTPGAYAPYGLGTHTCLGIRWVELQMAVNVLLIAHHLKLEVTPASYELGINPFPTSAPDKKLKFRVAEVRNPVV